MPSAAVAGRPPYRVLQLPQKQGSLNSNVQLAHMSGLRDRSCLNKEARAPTRANRLAYTEKTFVLHETTACPTRHFWLSYTALLTFLHGEKGVFTRRFRFGANGGRGHPPTNSRL